MVLPDLYYIAVDQIFHFATIILIVYLIFRDNKTLNMINSRYDKLIGEVLDTVTKQQTQYKIEISADIRELSARMAEVLTALSQVVKGVKEVEKEVAKTGSGINEVVEAINEVVLNIKDVKVCDQDIANILKQTVEQLHQTTTTLNKLVELENIQKDKIEKKDKTGQKDKIEK